MNLHPEVMIDYGYLEGFGRTIKRVRPSWFRYLRLRVRPIETLK